MTDSIDLDDLDVSDENDDEPTANRGDWLWRGEGDPDDEPAPEPDASADAPADAETAANAETDADAGASADAGREAMPRVPRTNDDKPVGVPESQGGAGGAPAADRAADEGAGGRPGEETKPAGGGPHGGGVDDMTMAFTFEALDRLGNLQTALADAESWSDWIGIVGDVDAHVINKFQRDRGIDADFFNGTGSGPAERLAEIDEHSMFYAKRTVVVGVDGERWIADEADWEFVPLSEAADAADWALTADAAGGDPGADANADSDAR